MRSEGIWIDGEKMRELVEKSGLSIPKFAKKVKLSTTTVRNAIRGARLSEENVKKLEERFHMTLRVERQMICEGFDFEKVEKMLRGKGINPNDFFVKSLGKNADYWKDLKTGRAAKKVPEEIIYILSTLLECKRDDLFLKINHEDSKKTEAQMLNTNMGMANYLINLKVMIEEMRRDMKTILSDVQDLKNCVGSFDVRMVRPFSLLDGKIDKILDEFEIQK